MTKVPPLRVVSTIPPELLDGLPVLTAYGEPDDHLRLSVLIAGALRARGSGVGLAQDAQRCMGPQTSWDLRQDALWDMVRKATPKRDGDYFGILVDPDALDPGPLSEEATWDDRDFGLQRSKFRALVERIVKRNGWIVVRPRPSPELALPPPEPTALVPPAPELEFLFGQISPEVRPVLSWLVQSGNLSARDVVRRFDVVERDPALLERRLVWIAYNALQERTARVAERLSFIRNPLLLDEQRGPVVLLDHDTPVPLAEILVDERWMDNQALGDLRAAGFLQPWAVRGGREGLLMPRSVRRLLQQESELQQGDPSCPDWMGNEHRRLAVSRMDGPGLDSRLEVHHHAVRVRPVMSEDISRAFDTVRYYASDLRTIAFRLSAIEKRYMEAATVYEGIVDCDPHDAYAWEYLGYNLARAHGGRRLPEDVRERIVESYENAIYYDRNPDNPLYHGRMLGFLARTGQVEDIKQRFDQRMKIYKDSPKAVSYFASAVLREVPLEARRALIEPKWTRLIDMDEKLAELVGGAT